MALTNTTAPDAVHSAHLPGIWEFTSNRDTAFVHTVSSVASAGGFTRYTTPYNHKYVVGDVIVGSGFSETTYNVTQTITAVASTTITTDVTYVANDTGTLTRLNENFKVKARVRAGTGTRKVFTTAADFSGNYQLNYTSAHGYVIGDIIFIYNSDSLDGYWEVLYTPTKTAAVISATWGSDQAGSSVSSELIGAKIAQPILSTPVAYNCTSVASSGGFAQFTIGTHTFGVGEFFSGDGFTVSGYNVTGTITAVAATTITTTIAYVSDDDGIISTVAHNIYRFNVSGILRSLLSGSLLAQGSSNFVTPGDELAIPYALLMQEIFDDADGLSNPVTIDNFNDLTNNWKFAANIAVQANEDQDLDDYTVDSSAKKFLTDSPSTLYMAITDEIQLAVLTTNVAPTYYIRYETFDLGGASLGEASITGQSMAGIIATFPINSSNIFTSSSIGHAQVWLRKSVGNTQISEKKTIRIVPAVTGAIRVHFLNRRGGYDQYTFTGQRSVSQSGSKTIYSINRGISPDASTRGTTVIASSASKVVEVWSEFINEATATWLSQLLTSTDAYVIESGVQIPIVILNDSDIITDSMEMQRVRLKFMYANDIVIA